MPTEEPPPDPPAPPEPERAGPMTAEDAAPFIQKIIR